MSERRPAGRIETVLGSIPAAELGFCLPHEHIWCNQLLAPRLELFDRTRPTTTFMRLDQFDPMLDELIAYREMGGGAIVEVTCDGWGRDLEVLARLSEASGVHIIATAGFYIEPCLPPHVAEWSVERLADHLTREVERGVGATGRRCGVLKSAIHRARAEGLELKGLKAVAIAQRRTGLSVTTHTTGLRRMEVPGGNVAVEQLQILKAEGVPPERLIVGHVDERPDIDVLTAMAREGCFIQFDVIGKEQWLLDATRAELIREMIKRGFLRHLMMSHDQSRDIHMRFAGGLGYGYIFQSFLPRLRQLGVTDEEIRVMTVENPARAFAPAST